MEEKVALGCLFLLGKLSGCQQSLQLVPEGPCPNLPPPSKSHRVLAIGAGMIPDPTYSPLPLFKSMTAPRTLEEARLVVAFQRHSLKIHQVYKIFERKHLKHIIQMNRKGQEKVKPNEKERREAV